MTYLNEWLVAARTATKLKYPSAPELIIGKVLRIDRSAYAAGQNIKLSKKKLLEMNNLLGVVISGKGPARAVRRCDFHSINLKLNSKVLSPRAETEELVWWAEENLPKSAKVIDVGCGSGCIGLSLAKSREDLKVILTDSSSAAIKLSKSNAKLNKISNVDFAKSNLLSSLQTTDLGGSFFVANLPYLKKQSSDKKRLRFDPSCALYAGDGGLAIIKKLLRQLIEKNLLEGEGWVLLEHSPGQRGSLALFCEENGLSVLRVSDYVSCVKKRGAELSLSDQV